ncbi:hypothetical protein LR48_Vigan04g066900 [Vigna angularis]|uniref:Transposase (putative) gypsy type domain-containing protein n=1 Tax=Phaseolus angularis TaxID=3914 RepID=A0A0L9UCQ9_PHAAN|nr:hypothetical protein LR48_Vigan04g066900 [Vigna angularis]
MAVVHVESSSESSGRGGGRSAGGDGEHGSSPSSVSSSFLEESDHSPGVEPNFVEADKRIIYGIPIHLLKGGILVDGSPLELAGIGAVILGYDWAPHDANLFASEYATKKALSWRVGRLYIVRDVEDSHLIRAGVSLQNERVYHGKETSPDDFFFMYANLFSQLCVRVPFYGVSNGHSPGNECRPVQLHPNSWAAIQAFLVVCLAVGVNPTIPVFFHYFEVRPPPKGCWVSLTSVRDRTLFRSFFDSYKNFKDQFFKVIIDAVDRHEFHDAVGNPLFPFYWTRNPRKIKAYPVGVLSPADLEAVRTINALPRRLSAKGVRASSSSALRPPIVRRASSSSRLPKVTSAIPSPDPPAVMTTEVAAAVANEPVPSLTAVFVDPSSKAATTATVPLVRKRKEHREGEKGRKEKEGSSSRSASKKARKGKEGSSSRPLPGGVFSLVFNMNDRTNFHMSSSQWALIEPLSEAELTNAMSEMSTRADNDRLREECDQLKAVVSRQKKSEGGLLQVNRALTDDLAKAKEKISELEEVHLDAPAADDEPQEMHDPSSIGAVDQRVEVEDVDEAAEDADGRRVPSGSGSSGRTLRSPAGQIDNGSIWNSPFINLDFVGSGRQWFFGKNSPFTAPLS